MHIRDFREADANEVNALALAAFIQYKDQYQEWEVFSENIQKMSALASIGEIIVAEENGKVIGAVAYIGPGRPKAAFFDQGWPIIRMLVVDPAHRGKHIGRKLTDVCVDRAMRDEAVKIALHTSPIMDVALHMYLRMGFSFAAEAPPIHGVPYGVYVKQFVIDV